MDALSPLATIALAGFIHASFQLSVSTLTLLSTHAIGAKTAQKRLLKLVAGFVFGVVIMTLLMLSSTTLWAQMAFGDEVPAPVWAATCGLLFGLSVAIWIFYYRREPGTSLWIPRSLARYLVDRSKATHITAEALALGIVSVIAEMLFIVGPVVASALILVQLDPGMQLAGIITYAITSLLPFIFVALRIANGYNIGKIQRWRAANKGFLQFIAGCGLVVLAFCIYVNQVSGGAALMGQGF